MAAVRYHGKAVICMNVFYFSLCCCKINFHPDTGVLGPVKREERTWDILQIRQRKNVRTMIQLTPKRNSYQCLQVIMRQRTMNLSPNTRILWPVEKDKLDILQRHTKMSSNNIPEKTSETAPYDTRVLRLHKKTWGNTSSAFHAPHTKIAKARTRTKTPKRQSLGTPNTHIRMTPQRMT